MRKTILLTLLGLSAAAHGTNVQYDLSWALTNQWVLGYLVVIGLAAMLVLRRRHGTVLPDRHASFKTGAGPSPH